MRKLVSFLAGLAAGLVTGGVLALLFAPTSGKSLQEQIQAGVKRIVDEGKAAAEARRLELEGQLEAFKQGRPITLGTPKTE
jgi:gas vesicle protein